MALKLDTKAEINTAAPMTTPNSRNNLPNVLGKLLQKYRRSYWNGNNGKKISFDPLIAASIGVIPSTFLKIFLLQQYHHLQPVL
jgi:hypothetical protein